MPVFFRDKVQNCTTNPDPGSVLTWRVVRRNPWEARERQRGQDSSSEKGPDPNGPFLSFLPVSWTLLFPTPATMQDFLQCGLLDFRFGFQFGLQFLDCDTQIVVNRDLATDDLETHR